MDQCPVQGESKTLIRLTLQKLETSAGSMGHLARKGFSLTFLDLFQSSGGEDKAQNSSPSNEKPVKDLPQQKQMHSAGLNPPIAGGQNNNNYYNYKL